MGKIKEKILKMLKGSDYEFYNLAVILIENNFPEEEWDTILFERFSRDLTHCGGNVRIIDHNWDIKDHQIILKLKYFNWNIPHTFMVRDPTRLLKLVPSPNKKKC